jgi:hypothetical protein
LAFFKHGDIAPDMPKHDVELCQSVDQKLRAKGQAGGVGMSSAEQPAAMLAKAAPI